MSVPRSSAAAVLLNDGKVLVTGGEDCTSGTCVEYATSELYDPATGTWSAGGTMATPRSHHRAVMLSNGKVLVVGGNNPTAARTAELYNPQSHSFSSARRPAVPRHRGFQAVAITSGKALLIGGCCTAAGLPTNAVEEYDPTSNRWSSKEPMPTARESFTATVLQNREILVVGGIDDDATPLSSAIRFVLGYAWATGGTLSTARSSPETATLPSGRVLVTGGSCLDRTSEIYRMTTATWGTVRTAPAPRADDTATPILVNDGKVLVQGGDCSPTTGALYDWEADRWRSGPEWPSRREHVMVRLRNGLVLAAGGVDASGALSTAQLYTPKTTATAYATPNPVRAYSDTPLTVKGSGFAPHEVVELSHEREVYGTATANGRGNFTFSTEDLSPKNYIDLAAGVTSGRKAYFQVLVTES